jgi:hypothetical protein
MIVHACPILKATERHPFDKKHCFFINVAWFFLKPLDELSRMKKMRDMQ